MEKVYQAYLNKITLEKPNNAEAIEEKAAVYAQRMLKNKGMIFITGSFERKSNLHKGIIDGISGVCKFSGAELEYFLMRYMKECYKIFITHTDK